MSEVGEILELMHTSDLRWRTLRAEGREWRDEAGHLDAFLRRHPQRSSTKVLSFSARDPGVPAGGRRSETSEETWKLWLAPGKVRSEFEAGGETVAVVIRGDTWWSWSPSWGAQTNGGRKNSTHGTGSGEALIAPARILSCANLFVRGRTTALGRAAFAVRAVPVASDEDDEGPLALHGIGSGDDYELIVDAERGILLRSEARLRDRPVRVLEMRDVSFDEDLPEATFELAPPTRAAFETMMSDRSLLLEELPGAVPFTVFVPQRPSADQVEVWMTPERSRGRVPQSVQIAYTSSDASRRGSLSLLESAQPMPPLDWVSWREKDEVMVGEDRRMDPALRMLRLQREGTHVELTSHDLSFDEMIDLARSLVPLPHGTLSL
ncbi:MAG: hypothetical protein H0W27_06750 [Actinobacteria bacterium]|nr:hypothetical protein [Actinomycetota bacterium]